MKTLKECLRNKPIPVKIVAQYRAKNGLKYYLCKTEVSNIHYFMENENVIKQESFQDNLEKLYIKLLNCKDDEKARCEAKQQPSYISFAKFVYEQCGEEFYL